jgi:hypothetical protein
MARRPDLADLESGLGPALAVFARKNREIAAGVPAERFIVNNRRKTMGMDGPNRETASGTRAFSRQSRQGMGWLVRMS